MQFFQIFLVVVGCFYSHPECSDRRGSVVRFFSSKESALDEYEDYGEQAEKANIYSIGLECTNLWDLKFRCKFKVKQIETNNKVCTAQKEVRLEIFK